MLYGEPIQYSKPVRLLPGSWHQWFPMPHRNGLATLKLVVRVQVAVISPLCLWNSTQATGFRVASALSVPAHICLTLHVSIQSIVIRFVPNRPRTRASASPAMACRESVASASPAGGWWQLIGKHPVSYREPPDNHPIITYTCYTFGK